jgi:hypothetical protein
MTVLRARSVRLRMWWTTLLVLIALGGAGLAVAADRPQNPLQRPELTWRADRDAQPWIDALARQLALVDENVLGLSHRGRQVLGRITALDLESMNEALADGDQLSADLDSDVEQLIALRDEALAQVDEWRLGPATRTLFAQLGSATGSTQQVATYWRDLAGHARWVAGLVDALLRHDGLVFRATTAGRQANWDDALIFLEQAKGPIREATDVRDHLSATVNVDTLDDLLGRYRAYDEALTAMYRYIRDTGRMEGRAFDALQADVERAQAALPAETSAMTVIVAEAAGPPLTDELVAIEGAHGDILDALAAVEAGTGTPAT